MSPKCVKDNRGGLDLEVSADKLAMQGFVVWWQSVIGVDFSGERTGHGQVTSGNAKPARRVSRSGDGTIRSGISIRFAVKDRGQTGNAFSQPWATAHSPSDTLN